MAEVFHCHFCGERLAYDGWVFEENDVGEWWSEKLQHSVLAHADCLPMGATATCEGRDPEWKLA